MPLHITFATQRLQLHLVWPVVHTVHDTTGRLITLHAAAPSMAAHGYMCGIAAQEAARALRIRMIDALASLGI